MSGPPLALAVLRPLTGDARAALGGRDVALIAALPFRVGREARADPAGPWSGRERRRRDTAATNDLYLIDGATPLRISREHFAIERDAGGRLAVRDRGSACGLVVAGRPVGGGRRGGRAPLGDGDVVQVGGVASPYAFRFEVGEACAGRPSSDRT